MAARGTRMDSSAGEKAARPSRRPRKDPRITFDIEAGGGGAVAGADEAGRGSLAGPIVAAAVCLDYAHLDRSALRELRDLDDSKNLTRAQRETLYTVIVRHARQVSVASCSHLTIDGQGLHRSNLACLAACLKAMDPAPAMSLVDGFRLPAAELAHRAVVGGDGLSAAIAAASIVAKVTRDRIMIALHDRYPEYGFDRHVGYATRSHQEAILAHGICELHRRSFASVAFTQLELSFGAEEPPE